MIFILRSPEGNLIRILKEVLRETGKVTKKTLRLLEVAGSSLKKYGLQRTSGGAGSFNGLKAQQEVLTRLTSSLKLTMCPHCPTLNTKNSI